MYVFLLIFLDCCYYEPFYNSWDKELLSSDYPSVCPSSAWPDCKSHYTIMFGGLTENARLEHVGPNLKSVFKKTTERDTA